MQSLANTELQTNAKHTQRYSITACKAHASKGACSILLHELLSYSASGMLTDWYLKTPSLLTAYQLAHLRFALQCSVRVGNC